MMGGSHRLRRILRRAVPREMRLWVAVGRRRLRDMRDGDLRLAEKRDAPGVYAHCLAEYWLPIVDYAGQESLAEAKRVNQRLLAERLDGRVIRWGETFSFWKLAGRPTRRRGFRSAAALRNGRLETDIGGATCLLSTVVYNALLLAGLEVEERRCHSVDSYSARRYFEPGRDATIEYGYIDLRMRNTRAAAVQLRVEVTDSSVRASTWAREPAGFRVEIEISPPAVTGDGFEVRTTRVIRDVAGNIRRQDLGPSRYRFPTGAGSLEGAVVSSPISARSRSG